MSRGAEILPIDRHFARLMCKSGATNETRLFNLFVHLSQALRQQHSCLDLEDYPASTALISVLESLPCVGASGQATPLILDDKKLYLQRYHQAECRIARALTERNQAVNGLTPPLLQQLLAPLFDHDNNFDGQALAVLQALTRRLAIITGGPGTGKTTIVRALLAAMRQLPGGDSAVIKLAAPTGKAAMRLNQSLYATSPDSNQRTDSTVTTLHRLLGLRADGRSWQFNADNPLQLDMLVIDEVSMVDLAMMDRVLQALPPRARLVLIGDPQQLPSVETGNLLMDICKYPAGYSAEFTSLANTVLGGPSAAQVIPKVWPLDNDHHGLQDAVATLTHSYRFAADKGVGQLARAIQQGGPLITNETVKLLPWQQIADSPGDLADRFADYFKLVNTAGSRPEQLLLAFEKVRVLSAQREGVLGVLNLNKAIEDRLAENGWRQTHSHLYHGKPLMINRNDYGRGLFNGDVGICVNEPATGTLQVAFRDSSGDVVLQPTAGLPSHETCFAMTVHKSQGSEFDEVIFVLPPAESQGMSQLASRELLYTAVTRTRTRMTLYSSEATLDQALKRHALRVSGLGERLG